MREDVRTESLRIIYIICMYNTLNMMTSFQVYLERRESEGIQVLGARDLEDHLDLQVGHEGPNQPKVHGRLLKRHFVTAVTTFVYAAFQLPSSLFTVSLRTGSKISNDARCILGLLCCLLNLCF